MRWSLYIVALGLTAPAAAQMQEVTLSDAVQRALTVQPAMVQARGDARNADASMRASLGSFLPTITSNGSSTRAGGTRFDQSRNQIVELAATTTFSGGLTASFELFDGFRRFSDRSASAAGCPSTGPAAALAKKVRIKTRAATALHPILMPSGYHQRFTIHSSLV